MWPIGRKLKSMFTGEKKKEFDLNISQSSDSRRDRNNNLNISFHSESGANMDGFDSSRVDSFLDMGYSKSNITSVLNTPKRTTFLSDVYDIISEAVEDQTMIDFVTTKPLRSYREPHTIESKDFMPYLKKVQRALDTYKRNNNMRLLKQKEKDKINLPQELITCFKNVPQTFFDDKFVFNFSYLDRNALKMGQIQEDLSEHLDLVEMNLFYQITSRFQEFLDVILKLNEMEKQIENCLNGIHFLRNNNKDYKTKLIAPSVKILTLKRRQLNIQKTLQLLDLMKLVKDTIPTMEKLIHNNNFETAVNLLKESEEIYQQRLKTLASMRNCNLNFKTGRETLENSFRKEFHERCLMYMVQTLAYDKHSSHLMDESSVEQSFFNNHSTMQDPDASHIVDSDSSRIPWLLIDTQDDPKLENTLAKLIVENVKIREIKLVQYRAQLIERLKKFHTQFQHDMIEFVESTSILKENGTPPGQQGNGADVISKMNPNLYIKFIIFYLEIYKRVIKRQLFLNKKILESVLDYYNKNYVDTNMSNGHHKDNSVDINGETLRKLDESALKILKESVDEFYSVIASVIKFFVNQMTEMINKIRYDLLSIHEFHKLVAIFESIRKVFDNDLKINNVLNSWYKTDKPRIKTELNKLTLNVLDKISITALLNLRTTCEKNFIDAYHKQKMANLLESLDQETWIPCDIPDKYLNYFTTFFDPQHDMSNDDSYNEPDDTEEILKSSRPSYTNKDTGEILETEEEEKNGILQEEEDKNANNILATEDDAMPSTRQQIPEKSAVVKNPYVNIQKSEIFIHGKRYKVTASMLLLIKIICDFLHLAEKFKFSGSITVSKMFDLIKYYNSRTTQLILGAGAVHLQVIKMITAKILAFSSLCLALLVSILDPMQILVLKKIECNKDTVPNEINSMKNDILNHKNALMEKVETILKDRLVDLCTSISNLAWHNPQASLMLPTKFSAQILANTRSMYNSVEDYFLTEDLMKVFQQVVNDIAQNYLVIFENMNIQSKNTAQRVREELSYFISDLSKIKITASIDFASFEKKCQAIIDNKCNHLLEVVHL
jgi:vacuolar protein sorting-associated protein 54